MFKEEDRKGLSGVITTVLIILLGIIAVAIIALFAIPAVRDSGLDKPDKTPTFSLNKGSVKINWDPASTITDVKDSKLMFNFVRTQRTPGWKVIGYLVILSLGNNEYRTTIPQESDLTQGNSRQISIRLKDIKGGNANLGGIDKIRVVPYFIKDDSVTGNVITGNAIFQNGEASSPHEYTVTGLKISWVDKCWEDIDCTPVGSERTTNCISCVGAIKNGNKGTCTAKTGSSCSNNGPGTCTATGTCAVIGSTVVIPPGTTGTTGGNGGNGGNDQPPATTTYCSLGDDTTCYGKTIKWNNILYTPDNGCIECVNVLTVGAVCKPVISGQASRGCTSPNTWCSALAKCATPPAGQTCGANGKEGTEECDWGADVNEDTGITKSCNDPNALIDNPGSWTGGSVTCKGCRLYRACDYCGNGLKFPGTTETCDNDGRNGYSGVEAVGDGESVLFEYCSDNGIGSGVTYCMSDCTWASGCTGGSARPVPSPTPSLYCGDSIVTSPETCEGPNTQRSCPPLMVGIGRCDGICQIDNSGCSFCGNGIVEQDKNEVCEKNPNTCGGSGKTCKSDCSACT